MKRLERKTVKIGDNTFYIQPFAAFEAARISGELASLVSPVLGGVAGIIKMMAGTSGEGTGEDKFDFLNMDVKDVVPVVADSLAGIQGDKVESMMKQLLVNKKNISVELEDGTTVLTMDIANELFCCEIQDMYMLCYEVINLNFGSFFSKLLSRFGLQKKDMAAAAEKILTSVNTENSIPNDSLNLS